MVAGEDVISTTWEDENVGWFLEGVLHRVHKWEPQEGNESVCMRPADQSSRTWHSSEPSHCCFTQNKWWKNISKMSNMGRPQKQTLYPIFELSVTTMLVFLGIQRPSKRTVGSTTDVCVWVALPQNTVTPRRHINTHLQTSSWDLSVSKMCVSCGCTSARNMHEKMISEWCFRPCLLAQLYQTYLCKPNNSGPDSCHQSYGPKVTPHRDGRVTHENMCDRVLWGFI